MIPFPPDLPDDQIEPWQQAVELFHQAYRHQREGDLASALRAYQQSIRLYPTAEAHTFLGKVYSALHLNQLAITSCRAAIELDSTYGNAFNDLGAYLIELGHTDEALLVLDRALRAPRGSHQSNAYFNIGRAQEQMGLWIEAVASYNQSLEIEPSHTDARNARDILRARLN